MNRKLTGARLRIAELELTVDNRRAELERLEDSLAEARTSERMALFADVAGYGEADTPSMPKRSAYMPGHAGELAWVAAYERWERYSKLMASEFPMWSFDFGEFASVDMEDVADSCL